MAGLPLEPLRMLGAMAICAVVAVNTRFAGALAMLAVIFGGWLQHGVFRITLVAAAALLGICIRLRPTPRAAIAILVTATVTALTFAVVG